jgi:hypothetical protein
MSMRARIAARIFGALTSVAVAFQIALALGAPWGEFTMGGAFPGRLPTQMRVAATVSALLLTAFGVIVAVRAGLWLPSWRRHSRWMMWIVVAYSLIGVVLNAITPSARERALWLPVAITLAICAILVASSEQPSP